MTDRYATKYAIPHYEDLFLETDDPLVRRRVERHQLFVEYRGNGLWAVTDAFRNTYNQNGTREREPRPSSRTESYLEQHRFPIETALKVAIANVEKLSETSLADFKQVLGTQGAKDNPDPYKRVERIVKIVEEGTRRAKDELLTPKED